MFSENMEADTANIVAYYIFHMLKSSCPQSESECKMQILTLIQNESCNSLGDEKHECMLLICWCIPFNLLVYTISSFLFYP